MKTHLARWHLEARRNCTGSGSLYERFSVWYGSCAITYRVAHSLPDPCWLVRRNKTTMPKAASEIASTSALIASQLAAQKDRTARTLHALRRQWSKELAGRSGKDVVRIALRLVEGDEMPYRFLGCALVFYHQDAVEYLRPRLVERLGQGIDSWGDVDVFAGFIAGPAWRERRVADT